MPSTSHAIAAKLLSSGHYFRDRQGRLVSQYFPERRPLTMNTYAFTCRPGHAPLVAGTENDVKLGNQPVYALAFGMPHVSGLESNVRIEVPGAPPIYVVDNHQMAYFGWAEAAVMGHISAGATLIHVDAHSDASKTMSSPRGSSLFHFANYVRNILTIENFILPAVRDGLINHFWWVRALTAVQGLKLSSHSVGRLIMTTSNTRFLNRLMFRRETKPDTTLSELAAKQLDSQKFILDIDLDAIVAKKYLLGLPDEKDFESAAELLSEIAMQAGVVTIATSPGYADQAAAVIAAKLIVRKIMARAHALTPV